MSRPRLASWLAAGVSSLLLTSVAIADTTAATTTTEPDSGAVEILPPDESLRWGDARRMGRPLGGSGRRVCPKASAAKTNSTGPVFFVPASVGSLSRSVRLCGR